jgi:hypothetical protein
LSDTTAERGYDGEVGQMAIDPQAQRLRAPV